MKRYTCVITLAIACLVLNVPRAAALDMSKVTCQAFLAAGTGNIAVMIMWLRGYHAGKGGTVAFETHNPYGGRLGFYCKAHPSDSVLDASEQILTELDRGI